MTQRKPFVKFDMKISSPIMKYFVCDDAIFTVSEYMAISLTDLNGSAIPPNEI
jgi:hypothetical protein